MYISAEERLSCHAVVIGGGPAGTAAAHAAAASGLAVILVERGQAGRDKACGDMFMPSATAILGQMGFDAAGLRALGGFSCDAIEIRGARGLLWKLNYAADPVWILPRRLIDQALRDSLQPRVPVVYDASVFDIAQGKNGRLVASARGKQRSRTLRFECDAVIAAGGAQDSLAARWGISGEPVIAPSVSAYVECGDVEAPAFGFSAECRPGYWWMFPAGANKANAGICALDQCRGSRLKSLGGELLASFDISGDGCWRGGAGALWSGKGSRWHHDAGIVACGDAAGLIDPLNGEGLTAALRSGHQAGMAVSKFLNDRDLKWLRGYSAWVGRTFSTEYDSGSSLRTAWRQLCGVVTPQRAF